MTIMTFTRLASRAEMAVEMDRRGVVIEALERRIAELEAAATVARRAGAEDMREQAALVAETPDRRGRDFVPESLWDNIKRETAVRIRALPVEE